jgi:cobalt/nickel transport system ATP-binding protein
MSHHRLEVQDLIFAYEPGNPVLDGISFVIRHGESIGIIGANGAGKSTLLLLLLGVLRPSDGRILVGDTELTAKTLPQIRQRLGLVFQDPDDQLFMPTVAEDVAFGPRNAGLSEEEVSRHVRRALEQVGLASLGERPPFRLSGGEKRAAAIATVLAMEPDVLILDEPSAALDPRTRRRLIGLLNQFEHTRIITGHDLDLIWETCSRTIVLDHGHIAADGRTVDILTDQVLLEAAGLELPLSRQQHPAYEP